MAPFSSLSGVAAKRSACRGGLTTAPQDQAINEKDDFTKMRLFIGNLPYSVGQEQLKEAFEQIGRVDHAHLIVDFEGKSKGYAFVDMPDDAALKAIKEFDGAQWGGRDIAVNMARPRERKSRETFA
jgi:RNA recognition motif-containing protein